VYDAPERVPEFEFWIVLSGIPHRTIPRHGDFPSGGVRGVPTLLRGVHGDRARLMRTGVTRIEGHTILRGVVCRPYIIKVRKSGM
jgi:hypothetical protein